MMPCLSILCDLCLQDGGQGQGYKGITIHLGLLAQLAQLAVVCNLSNCMTYVLREETKKYCD